MSMPKPHWLSSGTGGTPLVLLHGMGSTAEVWLPQLQALSRQRQVIAWTAPGYGASPALESLDWPSLADALAAMLDALDIPSAHVLGHSIGGMVAQEFYHRHASRVASLVLSATSAAFGAKDPQWTEDFIRLRMEPIDRCGGFPQAAPAMLRKLMHDDAPDSARRLAELAAQGVERDRYLAYMRLLMQFDRKAEAADIHVPVLLLAGEHDTQAPPRGMQSMAQRIPGARLHVFPGVAHMANLEASDAFNQTLEAFLTQASGQPPTTPPQDIA